MRFLSFGVNLGPYLPTGMPCFSLKPRSRVEAWFIAIDPPALEHLSLVGIDDSPARSTRSGYGLRISLDLGLWLSSSVWYLFHGTASTDITYLIEGIPVLAA